MNATKSKNKINMLQRIYTSQAAPISMTQMRYKPELCQNRFIKKAVTTIEEMNIISHKNYCATLMKVLKRLIKRGGVKWGYYCPHCLPPTSGGQAVNKRQDRNTNRALSSRRKP